MDHTGSSPAQALSHGDRDDESWGDEFFPSPLVGEGGALEH